jgi:hypothetical protein
LLEEDEFYEEGEDNLEEELEVEEEVEQVQPEPRKRRVVGIVRRRFPANKSPTTQASPQPAPAYPPIMAGDMGGMPQFFAPRQNPEYEAKLQAKKDIAYQKEMMRYQLQMQRENAPRPNTGKKLLRVANQYARGDGTTADRVNVGNSGCLFKRPNVDLPTRTFNESNMGNNLNKMLKTIRPKVAKKKKGFSL